MQHCRLLQALISKNPDKLEFFCATIICPGFFMYFIRLLFCSISIESIYKQLPGYTY